LLPAPSRRSSRTWCERRQLPAGSLRQATRELLEAFHEFSPVCACAPERTSLRRREVEQRLATCCTDRASDSWSRTTCSTERVDRQPQMSGRSSIRDGSGIHAASRRCSSPRCGSASASTPPGAAHPLYDAAAAKGDRLLDRHAASIYGWYTFGVYAAAIPGGIIAIAARPVPQRAVGGVIIALGHFSLAYPSLPTFYLGLTLIVSALAC